MEGNTKQILQLKKDIKSWESMFLRKHGCRPSKEDIKNSPLEIKNAYRDYQRLKNVLSNVSEVENSASIQPTVTTVSTSIDSKGSSDKIATPLKPNNEVFGYHLNKMASGKLPKQKMGVNRPQKTRKWIKGCGFKKEEPEEKTNEEEGKATGEDVSMISRSPEEAMVDISSLGSSVGMRDTSQPVSVPLKSLTNDDDNVEDLTASLPSSCVILKPKLRHGHGISELWLNSVKSQLGSNQSPSSNQEKSEKMPQACIKKGSKNAETCLEYLETQYQYLPTRDQTTSTITQEGGENSSSSFSVSSKSDNPYLKTQQVVTNLSEGGYSTDEGDASSDSDHSDQSISSMEDFHNDTEQYCCSSGDEEDGMKEVFAGYEEREGKTMQDNEMNYDRTLLPDREEHFDNIDIREEEEEGEAKPIRRKMLLDRVINEVSVEMEPTEIEHMLTAVSTPDPHGSDLAGPSHENTSTQEPKPKGLKKVAVSDNFVRLNMKVKRFSRKTNRMTGSQYKRQQWKQREKQKGLGGGAWSRGGTSCFKCGKPGHWARNCTNTGGFKNLGKFDGQDVCYSEDQGGVFEEGDNPHLLERAGATCTFPTVEEAVQMLKLTETPGTCTVSVNTTDQVLYRSVEPFLELKDGNVLNSAPEEVMACLNTLGYQEFRTGQEAAVLQILSGVSTILVQPTGSGKSLCYQLPAYCYAQRSPGCITLVISPLISLMQDQVHNFPAGLSGACIHTGLSRQQRDRITTDVAAGMINILLISPETLVGGAVGNGWSFLSASKLPPIAFACIDEAHCLSEWSHNFRPSYLRLCKVLRQTLGVRCILGLTATASSSTIDDMADLLGVRREHIITGSAVPHNLILSVSCEDNREQAIVDLLHSPPFCSCESILVYCTRQQTTERVAQLLRTSLQFVEDNNTAAQELDAEPTGRSRSKRGAGEDGCGKKTSKRRKVSWSAECYHAGLSPAQRKRNQSDFMSGRLRVLVCTVAFGMGLDKPDVRSVIHYNMPKSFESYVQEIGRAGRDGDPAYCHVFIDNEGSDLLELRRHVYANGMDYLSVKQLVQKALPTLCCHSDDSPQNEDCHGHEVAIPIETLVQSLDTKEEVLLTLLCYLELRNKINLFNPINDTCCLRSYGGVGQLRGLSRRVPAVAMAIGLEKQKGTMTDLSSVTFSVTEVANALHCDSGTVQQVLRDLQYSNGSSNSSSNVMMEFSNLSFHLKTTRCFSNEEKDTTCQQLVGKIKDRERREVERLYQLYAVLKHVSVTGLTGDTSNSSLKDFLQLYFSDKLTLEYLQSVGIDPHLMLNQPLSERRLTQVKSDIRSLISIHDDRVFTGRAVARILQGIPSPCYPAEVWGRRMFNWRKYLDVDFNTLCKIATGEIVST